MQGIKVARVECDALTAEVYTATSKTFLPGRNSANHNPAQASCDILREPSVSCNVGQTVSCQE